MVSSYQPGEKKPDDSKASEDPLNALDELVRMPDLTETIELRSSEDVWSRMGASPSRIVSHFVSTAVSCSTA
jgi:hypothetical protein